MRSSRLRHANNSNTKGARQKGNVFQKTRLFCKPPFFKSSRCQALKNRIYLWVPGKKATFSKNNYKIFYVRIPNQNTFICIFVTTESYIGNLQSKFLKMCELGIFGIRHGGNPYVKIFIHVIPPQTTPGGTPLGLGRRFTPPKQPSGAPMGHPPSA